MVLRIAACCFTFVFCNGFYKLMFSQATSGAASPTLGTIAESSSHAQREMAERLYARRFRLMKTARELLPDERIAQCQHAIVPNCDATVQVCDSGPGARYRNLIRCDSSSCIHCSSARSEQDRHELTVALAQADRDGLFPLLLTFTLSHQVSDNLELLRAGLRTAFDRTFSGRWYQDFKEQWQVVGKITAQELTYGRNGWHPHLHVLLFCRLEFAGIWPSKMQESIAQRWQDKLATMGYTANLAHGVDVRTATSDIADYVVKWGREPIQSAWGVDVELAKANVKRASLDGLTPFKILGAAAGEQADLDEAQLLLGGDRDKVRKRCAMLYKEFFYAMKGRARLHWGEMKTILEIDEALYKFEQDNPEDEPKTWDIALIERRSWFAEIVGNDTGIDLRADLLAVCSTRNAFEVRQWANEHFITGMVVPDNAYIQTVLVRDKLISQFPKRPDLNETKYPQENIPLPS